MEKFLQIRELRRRLRVSTLDSELDSTEDDNLKLLKPVKKTSYTGLCWIFISCGHFLHFLTKLLSLFVDYSSASYLIEHDRHLYVSDIMPNISESCHVTVWKERGLVPDASSVPVLVCYLSLKRFWILLFSIIFERSLNVL